MVGGPCQPVLGGLEHGAAGSVRSAAMTPATQGKNLPDLALLAVQTSCCTAYWRPVAFAATICLTVILADTDRL